MQASDPDLRAGHQRPHTNKGRDEVRERDSYREGRILLHDDAVRPRDALFLPYPLDFVQRDHELHGMHLRFARHEAG